MTVSNHPNSPTHSSSLPRTPKPSISAREVLGAWGRILTGHAPMLSIEITRECPLSCPGCYAYGDQHLGGGITLSELNDKRGDDLVNGVIALVKKHKPLQVSLVGGEPLVRHKELSRILPILSEMGVFTMVVTSAVIPIPEDWMKLPRIRVAISVDGLPVDHDVRRKPATYERILKNISGREVNVHWTITRPMLSRPGYLEDYVAFWNARPEVNLIWVSLYSPQIGEESAEKLTPENRIELAEQLPALGKAYPKFLMNKTIADAFLHPPASPDACIFAKMSTNYSADFKSRVEPCVFGGQPDCSNCGCAASIGLQSLMTRQVVGPARIGHFVKGSVAVGQLANRLKANKFAPQRWSGIAPKSPSSDDGLVQIQS
ncbi:MAG: radical SAM protein [Candidatus Acidiferrales bacterium]|jgi:MoaA/NifB/PqqE/SkfB family radical SAM enzyme